MFLTGIHSSAIQLPESKEAIILPMYRKSILILLLIVLAVAGGTYYGCYMQEKESIQLDAASQTVTQGGSQEDRAEITVYVTGAINKPGVVTVREGARTADAVKACGGLLPTADGEKVNMAQVLKDGQQVRVPEKQAGSSACAALNLHAISRHSAGASRINVGRLDAGSGRNVIGDKALLCLETRGATSEINAFMETEAQRIIKAAAMMYDVKVDIEKVGGAAGGSNSPELAAFLEEEAKSLGIFHEVVGACPFGASEDFSYFMERVQSHGGQAAYMMVGANLAAGHHDSHFDFDERALGYSLKLMGCAVCKLLLSK